MRLMRFIMTVASGALFAGGGALAQGNDGLQAIIEDRSITVSVDNFVRAASDLEFGKYLAIAKGVNTFIHIREPAPIDRQPTIRMNRDVIYSIAVIDISEGATLSLPEAGERYMSAHVINQDHFMNEIFVGAGDHVMNVSTFDTPYVLVIIRTLVDASDPEDLAAVHALQDAVVLTAGSSNPLIIPDYDEESFDGVLNAAIELGRFVPDSSNTFGPKGEVDPLRYFLGAAVGWGGLPEEEAFYLNFEPGLPVGEYKIEVPADVPVDAYWSVSLYNADGFYEKNNLDVYNINSVMGERNDDGSTTVHFGGCEDGRVNCLPIMEGWNYTARLYRASSEVLDGSWQFPTVEPAN